MNKPQRRKDTKNRKLICLIFSKNIYCKMNENFYIKR